jgi:hypothetical protein
MLFFVLFTIPVASKSSERQFVILFTREMGGEVGIVRLLVTATLWVRIQTSLKNHKWAT